MLVGLTGACANQSPPPGGPEDSRPPVIVRTEPDTFGVMLDGGGRVRFQFDERISENVSDGDLSSAVTVSPRTGEVRVSHGRNSLEVSLEGGFQPGLVYRVTLLPVVSDMFGNRLPEAFEVVFSTGGEPPPTATLAGEVWDRVGGQGLNGAAVLALGTDSLVHVARADAGGVFAFRYLPTGDFAVTAFQDGNRDGEVGPRESSGSTFASIAAGDTLLIDIPVLTPDTTPAQAGAALALDSVTVVVGFDDYLDPGVPVEDIAVTLSREAGDAPSFARLFHEAEYVRYVDQIADSFARLDSIDAATRAAAAAAAGAAAPGDSAAAARDSADAATDSLTAPTPDAGPDAQDTDSAQVPARPVPPRLSDAAGGEERYGRTLPGQRLVGIVDAPLEPGEYRIGVGSVVNINGLPGGGGEVVLTYEPPPPQSDSIPPDAATPADDADGAGDPLRDPAGGLDPPGPNP